MEQGPSSEAASPSGSQEITRLYETKNLLQFSQQPATAHYPEPDESSPHSHFYFFKTHFNIILSTTPTSPDCSFPSGLPSKIFMHFLRLP
jgi:hypothetical protein